MVFGRIAMRGNSMIELIAIVALLIGLTGYNMSFKEKILFIIGLVISCLILER